MQVQLHDSTLKSIRAVYIFAAVPDNFMTRKNTVIAWICPLELVKKQK
jgi:hypothetical protein